MPAFKAPSISVPTSTEPARVGGGPSESRGRLSYPRLRGSITRGGTHLLCWNRSGDALAACKILPRRALLCSIASICTIAISVNFAAAAERRVENPALIVAVDADRGTYTIEAAGKRTVILKAVAAAEVDHRWVRSAEYPQHELTESVFEDVLGRGHQLALISSGRIDAPDLILTVRLYESRPAGEIQLVLANHTGKTLQIQRLRSLQAVGDAILDLGATPAADRVLSDSFSEDWPPLQIYALGGAPQGRHRAVGSQLIYNRSSGQGVLFGALTAERLLTILHLNTRTTPVGPAISEFTIDSAGTTEIQATDPESGMLEGPPGNLIELTLPVVNEGTLQAERLMFSAGPDYHAQLEAYGDLIHDLHRSPIPKANMLGWWSWTAFYTQITEDAALSNATWLTQHLKSAGYDWFHFDLGYSHARGDYTVPNLEQFPHGMQPLVKRLTASGLQVGVWTAPFEVAEGSSVYRRHRDWLLHNAKGEPIQITTAEEHPGERVFVLDTTHPAAQRFLRETYRTLARSWGVRYIKLDFMDNTAIEAYYHRSNTTALEAQRIGLQIIREAVGDDVLLDKDGSPMLSPVGFVNDGRISQDTGHTFARSREAAPAIAARYYMHRKFFWNDPDAFTVSRQLLEERTIEAPLTLDEAEVSIVLSVVSGGLFEIGDDLLKLAQDPDRVALVTNPELLRIAKLGHAATPVDLLTYSPEDLQPSLFRLRDSLRESTIAVFNWTDRPRTRRLSLQEFGLAGGKPRKLKDALHPARPLKAAGDTLELELPAHSVRLIRVVDLSA